MTSARFTSHRVPLVESLESRQFLAADLSVVAASAANLASAKGAKTGAITIKNTGTTTISGPVTVTFVAIAKGKTQTLGTAKVTLSNLKPKATKPVTGIKLKAPTNTTSASVKFNITAKITAKNDAVAGNNSKAAGSVTIAKSSSDGGGGGTTGGTATGQAVFGIDGVGTKLSFHKTGNPLGNLPLGALVEAGTFTDGNGHSGKYYLTLPASRLGNVKASQLLDLDFDESTGFTGGSRRYELTFTPASKRLSNGLNNKSVTFSTSSKGASAKGDITSSFLHAVYLKY